MNDTVRPRVAIDAVGGDGAPAVIIEGALQAIEQFDVDVMLVGPERPSEYRFNPFAGVVHGSDHLVYGPWQAINAPTELQTLPVV